MAIILDVMMLDMEAWRFIALKADPEMRDIPVIMMTMVSETDAASRWELPICHQANRPRRRHRF